MCQFLAHTKSVLHKNRLFTVIAAIVVILMVIGMITNKKDDAAPVTSQSTVETTTGETTGSEEITDQSKETQWRFYWIDLWIFVIGGGFCTIMIFRERKKAREKLK